MNLQGEDPMHGTDALEVFSKLRLKSVFPEPRNNCTFIPAD